MVNFCAVPGCSNHLDQENQLSYYRLPLNNKAVLKQWIHNIGRANLSLKDHTRVCSEHFANAQGRRLRPDEVPTLKLPARGTKVSSYLHVEPSLDTRLLVGKDLEVLLRFGTKTPA